MTRESAPKGALTIVTATRDQDQGSSAAVRLDDRCGPLPLSDLQLYAEKFAALAVDIDGVEPAELVEVLAFVLRRVSDSLAQALQGAA